MRHAIFAILAIAAALLQVVLVNGLPWPGGGAPDIALVLVVVIGLTQGPLAGLLAGFCAGLSLDLAPPGGYLAGASALVFCLIGYGCGRAGTGSGTWSGGWDGARYGRSALRLAASAVVAVCAGEAAEALCGLIAPGSGVTVAAVGRTLPAAVLYDVLTCGVLLFGAAAASRARPARTMAPMASAPSASRHPARWRPAGQVPGRMPGDRAAWIAGRTATIATGAREPWQGRRAPAPDGERRPGERRPGPRPDLGDSAMRQRPGPAAGPVRLRLKAPGGGLPRKPARRTRATFRPGRTGRARNRTGRLDRRPRVPGSFRRSLLRRAPAAGRAVWPRFPRWTGGLRKRGGQGVDVPPVNMARRRGGMAGRSGGRA